MYLKGFSRPCFTSMIRTRDFYILLDHKKRDTVMHSGWSGKSLNYRDVMCYLPKILHIVRFVLENEAQNNDWTERDILIRNSFILYANIVWWKIPRIRVLHIVWWNTIYEMFSLHQYKLTGFSFMQVRHHMVYVCVFWLVSLASYVTWKVSHCYILPYHARKGYLNFHDNFENVCSVL